GWAWRGRARGRKSKRQNKCLPARHAHMPAMICNLDVRNQKVERLAALGLPNYLFVEQLAAASAQQIDDPLAMRKVKPAEFRIVQMKLVFFVTEEITKPPVVEQNTAFLVD